MDALDYLTKNYTQPAATVGSQTYSVPGLLMPQSADAFKASLSQYNSMMNSIAKSIVSSLGGNRVQGLGAPSSRVEQFDNQTPEEGAPSISNDNTSDGGGGKDGGSIGGPNGDAGIGGQSTSDGSQGDTA